MLVDAVKRVQADTFALYSKTHFYHWNVEGPDFVQYHEFLGELYAELFAAVDPLAEHVRKLDSYAPGVNRMITELAHVKLDDGIPEALEMFKRILTDNDTVMEGIITAFMSAEAAGEMGLANFLQDRLDVHKKHRWMLKAITK
jgi:starvation-inducible DNA-binding protein